MCFTLIKDIFNFLRQVAALRHFFSIFNQSAAYSKHCVTENLMSDDGKASIASREKCDDAQTLRADVNIGLS
jgi:hypothetical protein